MRSYISTALELHFFGTPGFQYQAQRSNNMHEWEDVLAPVEGVGAMQSILISFEGEGRSRDFFQVVEQVIEPQ